MDNKQVQIRRGTTSQHAGFTGAVGEITVDTTKKAVVVHDGITPGGNPQAQEAVVNSLGSRVTVVEQAQAGGHIGFAAKAAMDADLAHPANTLAEVTNDPTPANNGTYIKLGASGAGSWQMSSYDRFSIFSASAAIPDADRQIRNGYVPAIAYIPPQGIAELDGNYTYSAAMLGFIALMSKSTTFDKIIARLWCTNSSLDIQWRVYLRSSMASFDTTSLMADDSGTIFATNFPHSSAQLLVSLNKVLTAAAGQYVFFLFRSSSGADVSISCWDYNAGVSPARIGVPLSTSISWPTSLSFGDPSTHYGTAGMQLLLSSGQLASLIAYDPKASGFAASNVQTAIDQVANQALPDANMQYRGGYQPYVTYAPVLGDSELAGDYSYSAAAHILGFYALVAV